MELVNTLQCWPRAQMGTQLVFSNKAGRDGDKRRWGCTGTAMLDSTNLGSDYSRNRVF